jgi:hypothetical protein
VNDVALKLELAGALLEVLFVPEARFRGEFRAIQIIANRRFPGFLG